ncbi:MAG TPA: bifunctional 4-hydroxy-2-oxoglutarate aldolase/2-dehydro-3-deoxy-phosphogluconate aldolase [Gammaproteobacteria bacterium]|nr:bifunctional 4-hydroxy-2-oxoglutarate aldolase/2-dehydro-3-deoxy-phosphogluconate aldolase [Gammaproteobacteria bacterium]
MNVRDVLKLSPVIPVLTVSRLEHAAPLASALVRGGLKVLEITLRTECALDAITEMRDAAPDAVIGAGTLTRAGDFAAVQRAGAQFAVTPGLTPDLMFGAGETRLPLLPGVMTPTELIAARAAGFRACKLFPAQQAGGVGMLKALAGPFPDVVFCPTGGITRANAPEFLAQPNVACVGGSWLAPRDLVEARDWATIEALARDAASLRGA